jgi:nucleoside-diphosphate-sugar epimerase
VRLLLIGGPRFLGHGVIEEALARGHDVTTFNRGQTNPDAFPQVEKLRGDRAGDLSALEGRSFDAVVDTCGYVPGVVRRSAQAVTAGAYCFVSSVNYYADHRQSRTEDDPPAQLGDLPDDRVLEDYSNYGPLKVLCEQAVTDVFGDRALLVRPGLICGPNDPTDRFTYWARRPERGGPVLAPAPADEPVQLIDVRDLAGWIVRSLEAEVGGALNATSPRGAHTRGSVLAECGATDVVWVDGAWLVEHGVDSGTLALWIDGTDPDDAHFYDVDVSRAVAAGLTCRPVAETARDAPAWSGAIGLGPERESELLEAWAGRVGSVA